MARPNRKLSIVIPTLNAGATLAATLASLQADLSIAIAICDGGSKDDTAAIARQAGATGWIVKPFDPVKLVDAVRRVAA